MAVSESGVSGRESRWSMGFVEPGYEPVQNQFDAYLLDDPTFSAQLAIYFQDRLVVRLSGGPDLDADSLTGVFSATKGVAALTTALLIESGELDLDARVTRYWPEFGQHGKDHVTVRELLAHKAGIPGVIERLTEDEILDSALVAERLAAQRPVWRPGSCFGYHGRVVGVFMEELVRRLAHTELKNLYESEIRSPRGIEFFLGLPRSEERRYRSVLPMKLTPAQVAAAPENLYATDDLGALMMNRLGSDVDPYLVSTNSPAIRAAGPAAYGGVGSAEGLARAYAAALGFIGSPFLARGTLEDMAQQESWGVDRVLNIEMSFAAVFMKSQPRMNFGSYAAFGHDGAGGALGFADPLHEISFGYIPLPMQYPGGADPRAVRLSQIARACTDRVRASHPDPRRLK